jgi:O-antigen ligase
VALGIAVAFSSAVNSDNPFVTLYAARWLPFLVITVVLIDLLTNVVEVRVAVSAITLGAVVSAAGALWSFLILHDDRASGPLQDPNDLAYVLVAALPFVLFAEPRRTSLRIAQAGGVLILLAGTAATLSRGAIVASLFTLAWAISRRLVSWRVVVGGLLLVAACAGAIWLLAGPKVEAALAQKTFIAQNNIDTRELRWESAARLLAEHPVVGVGPGGVRAHYVAASNNAELAAQNPVTHNMYLEVGAELGVVGLAIFGGVIVVALSASESALREPLRHAALGVQGSLIMVIVASTFLSEEYYMPLWAGVAVAAALQSRSRGLGLPS